MYFGFSPNADTILVKIASYLADFLITIVLINNISVMPCVLVIMRDFHSSENAIMRKIV